MELLLKSVKKAKLWVYQLMEAGGGGGMVGVGALMPM